MQIIFSIMENIFSRLRKVINYKGVSNNEFGRSIGCSSAQITQMLTHEKNFGIDKMLKILSTYPEVNSDWLLTGRGEMLRETKCTKSEKTEPPTIPQTVNTESKDSNNKVSMQEPSYIIDKLFQRLEEKDSKIEELSKEIGRLEQVIEGFDRKGDTAGTARIVSAG
jgi:predicted ribosome quality control (RQC) complex YloA/Tae2 family protein